MPRVFDKLGVRFLYPDNWTIDESEVLEGNNTVSLYAPDGAFWSIIVHPAGYDPRDLVEAAEAAMRQEYEQLDSEPYHDVVAETEVVGCDLNFYCLDLTNTALIRSFGTDQATYLILCQAEDREFTAAGPIFEAITRSVVDPGVTGGQFARQSQHLPAAH